jgi:hypothetical protein
MCASALAGSLLAGRSSFAQTPDGAQDVQQQIDQLRRDFEGLKQQYGDRLTALERRLSALQAGQPTGASPPAGPVAPVEAVAAVQSVQPATDPQQPTSQIPAGAEGAGGPTGQLPIYGGGAAASKVFNPDIAVIGDFLGAAGKDPTHPDPFGPGSSPNPLQMHESEAALQAIVDPYARADFFISFGETGVNLEEGFITFPAIPGGLLLRVGNPLHG